MQGIWRGRGTVEPNFWRLYFVVMIDGRAAGMQDLIGDRFATHERSSRSPGLLLQLASAVSVLLARQAEEHHQCALHLDELLGRRAPTPEPTLVRLTVVILSTMTWLSRSNPVLSSGWIAIRSSGAFTIVLVSGITVTDAVASNWSSCRIRAGRGVEA